MSIFIICVSSFNVNRYIWFQQFFFDYLMSFQKVLPPRWVFPSVLIVRIHSKPQFCLFFFHLLILHILILFLCIAFSLLAFFITLFILTLAVILGILLAKRQVVQRRAFILISSSLILYSCTFFYRSLGYSCLVHLLVYIRISFLLNTIYEKLRDDSSVDTKLIYYLLSIINEFSFETYK